MHDEVRGDVVVAAATLYVDAAAREVTSALADAGVSTILLKGRSVADALYPHRGMRSYTDVDLLVDPERAALAGRVLRHLGYVSIDVPILDGRMRHAETWERHGDPRLVDLHVTLPWVGIRPQAAWRVLLRRTKRRHVGGAELYTLDNAALAVHLALHAVHHGHDAEHPLRDLKRALEQWDDGVWVCARAVAEELAALAAFRAGLMLVPRGAQLAHKLNLSRAVPTDVALAASGPRGALAMYQLVASRRWRESARIVAQQIVPPREFMRHSSPRRRRGTAVLLAYPHRWLVVLLRLGPALAAVRRERKGRGERR